MTPAHILIVEDDRIVARDIQQQLVGIGHTVAGVTGRGEEAVQLAIEIRPDIILMDIRLRGALDGVQAAEKIRELCQIPVIFLTSYADDETVKRASLTEPFGYLLKPFESSQLRTVIEMGLYKHAAEMKLRESERRYAATLSSIGDAVIATDNQARITFMNGVAEALTGWSLKEAQGQYLQAVFRIVNEDTRDPMEDPITKVLRSGQVVALANHALLIAREGEQFPLDDRAAPIIDDSGAVTGAVLVFRDMSERRRSEEALRLVQGELARVARLTTVGELAVSIAHEINQPLAAVVTNASAALNFLNRSSPDLEEARKILGDILSDASRGADIIRSLQSLASKSGPSYVNLRIDDVVAEVLVILQGELHRLGVVVRSDLNTAEVMLMADRVQLQQVLLNLIMNAIEAMQDGASRIPTLSISSSLSDGRFVVVEIQDNGSGINDTTLDRVFDPFFTTKDNGMGMGLSICRTILEAHGGRVTVARAGGHGTVARILIPLAVHSG